MESFCCFQQVDLVLMTFLDRIAENIENCIVSGTS